MCTGGVGVDGSVSRECLTGWLAVERACVMRPCDGTAPGLPRVNPGEACWSACRMLTPGSLPALGCRLPTVPPTAACPGAPACFSRLPPLLSWSAPTTTGISHGLVRLSVGLTGSPQQRLRQLEEAWLHMARHPASAVPAYKAVQVRCARGWGGRRWCPLPARSACMTYAPATQPTAASGRLPCTTCCAAVTSAGPRCRAAACRSPATRPPAS